MKKTIVASSFIALVLVFALGVVSSAHAAALKKGKERSNLPISKTKHERMLRGKGKIAKKLIVGKVTSMTDTSLHVKMGNKDYTVNVDSSTKVADRMGKAMKLSDVKTGDKVSVSGAVSGMTVQAKVVRDVSTPMPAQAKKHGVKGKKSAARKIHKP